MGISHSSRWLCRLVQVDPFAQRLPTLLGPRMRITYGLPGDSHGLTC